MWSYSFTGERSRFSSDNLVGFHVRLCEGVSEATVADSVRLALKCDFHLFLVDEAACGCVNLSKETNASTKIILRLDPCCHDGGENLTDRVNQLMQNIAGEEKRAYGVLLPWPTHANAKATSEDARRFVRTWNFLNEISSIEWLGTDNLNIWQLELVLDAFFLINENTQTLAPAVNLMHISATNQQKHLQRWCQSRAIETLTLLSSEDAKDFDNFFQQEQKSSDHIDIELFRISWALQSGLCPTFPNYDHWLRKGSKIHSAHQYESWITEFTNVLSRATKHLRSPTEHKRIHISAATLSYIRSLDYVNNIRDDDIANLPGADVTTNNSEKVHLSSSSSSSSSSS